jgi:predicted glycosyltransferase
MKNDRGRYVGRNLDLPVESIIAVRRHVIAASIAAFDPDLVIVDKVPSGMGGELLPAIRQLRRRGKAKLVLGLRDVLDEPAAVRSEWIREGNFELVTGSYDAVWVYGDRAICDPVVEYGFGSAIAAKLHHTGYLDPRTRLDDLGVAAAPLSDLSGNLALCLVGGGQDGAPLARCFAAAVYPRGTTGVIVTGPQMPAADVQALLALADTRPDLRVLRFEPNTDALLARASHVVSMGGYNTVMEILAHEKRALIVPRTTHRTEQLIRAERLSALGMVDVRDPGQVTSAAISQWLTLPATPRVRARSQLDFCGLGRVNLLARSLMTAPRARRSRPEPAARLAALAG